MYFPDPRTRLTGKIRQKTNLPSCWMILGSCIASPTINTSRTQYKRRTAIPGEITRVSYFTFRIEFRFALLLFIFALNIKR